MFLFVLGASVVYGVLAAWAALAGENMFESPSRQVLAIALAAWAGPTLTTWLTAECLRVLSPRRVLHGRLSMPVRRMALGGAAGALGSILGVLGMALLDRQIEHDVALTIPAAAIAALLVLLPTTHVRRGACLFCGYSLAGASPAASGRCTECGADAMIA